MDPARLVPVALLVVDQVVLVVCEATDTTEEDCKLVKEAEGDRGGSDEYEGQGDAKSSDMLAVCRSAADQL